MKPDYKLVAKAKYIHNTADLASELWHEVYKRYYPAKQLDTLVEELQSADAIEADIDNDVNYFLVFLGGKLIGYFAWKMENTALHLMHLYLKPEYRGKAIGRDIVLSCERLARGEGKGRMWCTVHAKALPVQQFFKALRYRSLKPAEQETASVDHEDSPWSRLTAARSSSVTRPCRMRAEMETQATTAKTPAVSAASRERVSRVPIPVPPMTSSPTTAPVMASTTPPRTPARIAGAAMGASMWTSRCQPLAPSSIAFSTTRMSSERSPTTVVVTIGKNATMAHRTAMGMVP